MVWKRRGEFKLSPIQVPKHNAIPIEMVVGRDFGSRVIQGGERQQYTCLL